MKRTETTVTDITLDLSKVYCYRAVRSDLRDGIAKYWVGHTKSIVGLQYIRLVDGICHLSGYKHENGDWSFGERPHVLIMNGNGFNCFAFVDGTINLQPYTGVELDAQEKFEILAEAKRLYEAEKAYVDHERRFLTEQPWLKLEGLTPTEAVDRLIELGW